MRVIPSLLYTEQPAKAQLTVKCRSCYVQLETDPTDVGKLVEERRFNGKFFQDTGYFGFSTTCPSCGGPVVFPTGRLIAKTRKW